MQNPSISPQNRFLHDLFNIYIQIIFWLFHFLYISYTIYSLSTFMLCRFWHNQFLLCHLRHNKFSIMSLTTLWIFYYVTYDIISFSLCHLWHYNPHIVLLITFFILFYKICEHIQFYNYYAFYRIIWIHCRSSYLPWT